jgi:N-methylhydantoinase A
VDFFAHGTTVVINALTERKGARVGLITTKGFRDVLEIGRGNRPDFFNLMYSKPEPFVERYLRREVPGRIDFKGGSRCRSISPVCPRIVADFQADGVTAVAICLIHAYANPAHEEAVLAELRRLWPGVAAVASHQITREWREYERTSTTVLSAYVQPAAERYLERLERGLKVRGLCRQPLHHAVQLRCRCRRLDQADVPITMVESGPASGFWGAAELGRIIGEPDVLALDIGGTTAKCSLIKGGHVAIKTDYWIERHGKSAGYPIMVPVVDLVEIGNGGGSIAWVDDFGKLHVGPKSAGAIPGPASYGRGGSNATTTDANLALGRINKDYFCGGAVVADMGALDAALSDLAGKLGMSNAEVARGIVRIANSNMVNALKLVSVNRGHDPRDFTLVVFGGGGPMHGVALGKELGVRKVVVPRGAPVFSAWGMLMSDLRRDYFVTELMDADNATALAALIDRTRTRALADFAREGVPPTGSVSSLSSGPATRTRNSPSRSGCPARCPMPRPWRS